jgi:hypothetical protein
MCTRQRLAEVRRFQKIAGILNEGLLTESPKCQTAMVNGKEVETFKWVLEGDPAGRYFCYTAAIYQGGSTRTGDGYLLKKDPSGDSGPASSTMEEGMGEVPTADQPCGPDSTAYVMGPSPDFACYPNDMLPTTIDGKPAKKYVAPSFSKLQRAPMEPSIDEKLQQLAVGDAEGTGGGSPLQCKPGETKWTDGPNSFYCYPTNGPNQPRRTATNHPA